MKSVTLVALASGLFTMVSAQTYPVITADDVGMYTCHETLVYKTGC